MTESRPDSANTDATKRGGDPAVQPWAPPRWALWRRWRRWSWVIVLLVAIYAAVLQTAPPQPYGHLLGLHVSGNHLVNSDNDIVVLHGVVRSGTEYACVEGWGIFDGPNVLNDDSQVPLFKSWGVNAVTLGLNEDCWLGINGVSAKFGGSNYQAAIKHEVATLVAHGIYPVLSLFWSAPGTEKATGQAPMPDADHSTAFWRSVAETFRDDPSVIFRIKEEPFPSSDSDSTRAWRCWLNGGAYCSEGFAVVGMQSLINTIRATGAANVIQVPGVQYANSMTQFLKFAPTDPDNNLMAAVDVYPNGNICGSVSCFDSEYAPVIAKYPFVAGEFGESVDGNDCSATGLTTLMTWFDQHGAGYMGWSWDTWGGCLQLVSSYSTGAPNGNWGNALRNHLLSLAGTAPTALPPTKPTPTPTATPRPTNTPTPIAVPTTSPTSLPAPSPGPVLGSCNSDGIRLVEIGPYVSRFSSPETVTLPRPSTPGDLLVATIATPVRAGYSAPPGWILAATATSDANQTAQIWYYPDNPGGITSVSFGSPGASAVTGAVSEWSGVAKTAPLDQTGVNTTDNRASTNVRTGHLFGTGDLAVSESAMFLDGGGTVKPTPGPGWSAIGSDGSSWPTWWGHGSSDYKLGVCTATVSESPANAKAVTWADTIAAFKPG